MLILIVLRQKFDELLKDRFIIASVKFFLLFMALFILILIWKWNKLPPQIPLFYSLPRSNEMLGSKSQILLLPLFSLVFYILNLLFSLFIYKKEKLAAIFLTLTGSGFILLLLITFIKIVFMLT